MVHASMSRVGPMLKWAGRTVAAMLAVIGPEGTMLVYISWGSVHEHLMDATGRVPAEWRQHVPGFDPRTSHAVRMNGIIAEFVRTMPGPRRSDNPGASVAAIGKRTTWITADHPQDLAMGRVPRSLTGCAGRPCADGRCAVGHDDADPPCRSSCRSARQAYASVEGRLVRLA